MIGQAIIIGAGFSYYAGLPLQSRFTTELLKATKFTKGPSRPLVEFLCQFVMDTFHPQEVVDAERWPELEDLFTCLDLSANSGHHLGANYPPAALRTIRRALIERMIRMMRTCYDVAKKKPDNRWITLDNLLRNIDPASNAFVSLNWDTVAEERMIEVHPELTVSYGQGFSAAGFPTDGARITRIGHGSGVTLETAKIHGSINWLYCDNCRQVFWFSPQESPRIAGQLLGPIEWGIIAPGSKVVRRRQWECDRCAGVKLSTRIATFSYRKALDFPMFQQSWDAAERHLANSRRWVFIGYSLPAADFEFKYLLKRIELSREIPPEVILVTGGDGAATTQANYRRFFGTRLSKQEFQNGLDDDAIKCITS